MFKVLLGAAVDKVLKDAHDRIETLTALLAQANVRNERGTAQCNEHLQRIQQYESANAGVKLYYEKLLESIQAESVKRVMAYEVEMQRRVSAEAGATYLREHNAYLLEQINTLREDLKESESRAHREREEAHAERDSLISQIVALSDPGAFIAMERAKVDREKRMRPEAVAPARGLGLGGIPLEAIVSENEKGVILDSRMLDRPLEKQLKPLVPAPPQKQRVYPRDRDEMRQEIAAAVIDEKKKEDEAQTQKTEKAEPIDPVHTDVAAVAPTT